MLTLAKAVANIVQRKDTIFPFVIIQYFAGDTLILYQSPVLAQTFAH